MRTNVFGTSSGNIFYATDESHETFYGLGSVEIHREFMIAAHA